MIRVLCSSTDARDMVHIGGDAIHRGKTFDIDAPALEAWLRDSEAYTTRTVLAVEVLAATKEAAALPGTSAERDDG